MWPFWDTTHYRVKSLYIDFDGNHMIIGNWHGQNEIWVQFWFVALQSHDFIGMSNHSKCDKSIPRQSWFFPVNARMKFISRNQVFEILSVFGFFLVRIFPRLDWIWEILSLRIQSECWKIMTRKILNTDIFKQWNSLYNYLY